jgi:hypothetical protein
MRSDATNRETQDRPHTRELVCVTPARPAPAVRAGVRPSAPFLCHLIAISQDAPQTRARRRGGAADATATYGAAAQCATPPGAVVRRSM